ncbi:response regulator [Acidocella sp.]|uniref:response regulator n=1 Tax=Acidocella sp. TaxID=50710 RepID=UPI00262C49C8|nr:response regulator [Acidocella sp.]
MDDEVLIRFAIADYLRECGYHVIEAADAAEALELLESQPGLVDLVFSDVQMPGEMDGFGLARWVRSNRQGLPVILTSGNARTAELGADLCEIGPLEAKPYDAKSLAQRMASLLAAAKRFP